MVLSVELKNPCSEGHWFTKSQHDFELEIANHWNKALSGWACVAVVGDCSEKGLVGQKLREGMLRRQSGHAGRAKSWL